MIQDFTIKVDKESRGRMNDLSKELGKIGVKVREQLKAIGVINASMDEVLQKEVEAVDGVSQVRRSKTYEVSPPESPVQ